MMSKAFIKQLVDECPGELSAEGVSEHLYSELKLVEEIKTGIKGYNAALNDENRRHEAKIKELDARVTELRKKCKHWERTYHPDPSGNSDSYYECQVCGKCT